MKGIIVCTADLIRKHFKQNIVLMIQIAVTILILLGFIGKIQYISSTSDIVNTFNSSNALYYAPFSFSPEDMTAERIIEENDLDVFEVGCVNHMLIDCNDEMLLCLGYSDAIIDRSRIKVDSGKWFDEYESKDIIPIVALNDRYSINDRIILEDFDEKEHEAIVIGKVSSDDYVVEFNSGGSESVISVESFAVKPTAAFIIPYNSQKLPGVSDDFDLKSSLGIPRGFAGELLFPGSKESYMTIEKAFSEYGTITDLDKMVSNNKRDIKFDLITNGVVLLVFTILTAAGIGGINGMQSRLDRRNYIIYYMMGMNKKQCAVVEMMRSFSIVFAGFVIALFLYNLSVIREMLYSADLLINRSTFAFSFIYIIFVSSLVSLKYVVDLGKGSLIDHYKNQE